MKHVLALFLLFIFSIQLLPLRVLLPAAEEIELKEDIDVDDGSDKKDQSENSKQWITDPALSALKGFILLFEITSYWEKTILFLAFPFLKIPTPPPNLTFC